MYDHFWHSSLYQNRPFQTDFILTTAYLRLFPASVIFQFFLFWVLRPSQNWSIQTFLVVKPYWSIIVCTMFILFWNFKKYTSVGMQLITYFFKICSLFYLHYLSIRKGHNFLRALVKSQSKKGYFLLSTFYKVLTDGYFNVINFLNFKNLSQSAFKLQNWQ